MRMFLFPRHFHIFISSRFSRLFSFLLCISPICAQDVFVMSLAQCSPLVVVIFTVHFGTALLSFLVFLVASVICNTMGMFDSQKRQTVYLTRFV